MYQRSQKVKRGWECVFWVSAEFSASNIPFSPMSIFDRCYSSECPLFWKGSKTLPPNKIFVIKTKVWTLMAKNWKTLWKTLVKETKKSLPWNFSWFLFLNSVQKSLRTKYFSTTKNSSSSLKIFVSEKEFSY